MPLPSSSLVLSPDPRLHQPAVEVEAFGAALEPLRAEMERAMAQEGGIGLAAPQIGHGVQALVVDTAAGRGRPALVWMLNPRLVRHSGRQVSVEGCLSVPGRQCKVLRPKQVCVRYQTLTGAHASLTLSGLPAACVLHEMDHLDGVLMTQRSPFSLALPSARLTNAAAA